MAADNTDGVRLFWGQVNKSTHFFTRDRERKLAHQAILNEAAQITHRIAPLIRYKRSPEVPSVTLK